MTYPLHRLTSIHGRRLMLTSTGAILDSEGYAAVMKSTADVAQNSTALLFSQLGVSHQSNVASSVASTLTNYGFQLLSSASATAITGFEIAAPVAGVTKEIHFDTSATEFSLGGTSTAVVFASTLVTANGSTLFVSDVVGGGGIADTVVILRGISATRWAIIGSTTNLAIG